MDDSTFLLQLKLYALNSGLIIIQKLIIMHTHSHTQRTAVWFTKSTAASRQPAVGSSGTAAASRGYG